MEGDAGGSTGGPQHKKTLRIYCCGRGWRGNIICKRRYLIPLESGLTIELDVFEPPFQGLVLAEVEFPSEEEAHAFLPPDWFGEEVTWSTEYHNSTLSQKKW